MFLLIYQVRGFGSGKDRGVNAGETYAGLGEGDLSLLLSLLSQGTLRPRFSVLMKLTNSRSECLVRQGEATEKIVGTNSNHYNAIINTDLSFCSLHT